MNPLRPSPRLLRKIAMEVGTTAVPSVRAWIDALRSLPKPKRQRQFAHTSLVQTYRNFRLCGFEVWRHLENSVSDPSRRKARLWFGRKSSGGINRALALATAAAFRMDRMTPTELREWWAEYRAARSLRRPVSNLWRNEPRCEDALDYSDRRQLSCVFRR